MSTPQPPNDDPSDLHRWLPPEEELDGPTAMFAAAGYARNLLRHAEAWGPHLISAMVRHGVLEAEEDPLEALERLIFAARCKSCRHAPCTCED
jgi:hypothetical protein